MVFPSVPPLYLDPTTWNQNPQQQLYHHQQQQLSNTASNTGNDHQNQLQPPGTSTSRANSMAERARLAKISMQPEGAPLPCPRCESTNTKFCYFNNYSLSQPRHFCKACRRYWTRGGALRNVPVGGGMRRNNKRSSKSGSSASAAAKTSTSSSTATSAAGMPASQPQLVNPAVMMTSAMTGYDTSVSVPNIGLGFSNMGLMSQIQQFPFLGGGLEQSASMVGNYPFLAGNGSSGSELPSQMESVKMEDSNRRRVLLNLERQYNLGMNVNNNNPRNENQLWGDQGSTTPGGVGGSGGGGGGGGVGGWMANLSGFNLSSATGSLF